MPDIPLVPTHWHFPARLASVGRARHAVPQALPTGLRRCLGDDLSLLTSELVTNAIRHGTHQQDERVDLVLWPADGHYWIAVSDPGTAASNAVPAPRSLDVDGETGRGLLLVDRLAAAWTIRPRPVRGVSVVAGLPLHRDG
ncbi:ATP-binding protein [Streptomyces millisiae]|uniref:ATP-binding protein n=1 Tax=Streptomyces millisiae TaxID=3075542 RepID=A0ABU2LLL2_9ACTN|nr:ATP-binding protein [Streptomyces sp. DSM 44918]MDT0318471.1 ATP-binding protein [Streptomyces sp. DSM 44918]